ncbi:MAG TPA: hypothetical protein VF641_07135, partial [Methylobacterium sp.]
MSEPRYVVDWEQVRRAFPPGLEPPALLRGFGAWLGGRPWGSVGCFDLSGSLSEEAPIVDGSPLRREFGLFLHLPDGGKAGFWYRPGHDPRQAPIVGLGSDGEAAVLASSLEGFLARLALKHFDDGRSWSDFAPRGDVDDAIPDLAGWLCDHAGLTDLERLAQADPDSTEFARRMESWMLEREAFWAEHPAMTAIARHLEPHRPQDDVPWGRTWFVAAIVGDIFELRVLHRGPQPVPEAPAIEPILRALRAEQARSDPDLGLWFGADLQLGGDG